MNFTAIDYETANGSPASACAVGLVKVVNGKQVDTAEWLIRPKFGYDIFHPGNIGVHGITPDRVRNAPEWPDLIDEILAFVDGDWLVAHNAGFDMGVWRGVSDSWNLEVPDLQYLCSLQVARKTYHLDSYRLPVAAMAAGFEDFSHHDALDDARASAAIMVHAAKRHDAADLPELAVATGVKVGDLKKTTTEGAIFGRS